MFRGLVNMGTFTLKANKGGGATEKPPIGNHMAVLVAVIDMGEQEVTYPGKPPAWARQLYFLWELCGEQIAGTTKNHVIGTSLTYSLNEKATMRKWIEARTGKVIPEGGEYDVGTELGQPCLLSIIEKNGYPRIGGLAALPKGLPAPKPTYPLTLLFVDDIKSGKEVPDFVPWHYGAPLLEHIKACRELGGSKPMKKAAPAPGGPQGVKTMEFSDIPF